MLCESVILAIGPASVVMSYLSMTEQQKLNLLCLHAYHFVMPAIKGQLVINNTKDWGDWLDWTYDFSGNEEEWLDINKLQELDSWRG